MDSKGKCHGVDRMTKEQISHMTHKFRFRKLLRIETNQKSMEEIENSFSRSKSSEFTQKFLKISPTKGYNFSEPEEKDPSRR